MVQYRRLWMLVLGLCVAAPLRAAEADKYLPSDSQFVVAVNVHQLLESPVVKKYGLEKVKEGLQKDEAKEFMQKTGLDPMKDVSSFLMAGNPSASQQDRVLVIVHGKFDIAKIESTVDEELKKKGSEDVEITKEGSTRLYKIKNKNAKAGQPEHFFAAFASPDTLLISPVKSYVTDGLSTSKTEAKLSKDLQAVLEKANSKKAVWMAGLITEDVKKGMANFPLTANIATKLESFTGSVGVTDAIQVDLHVHATDAKSAEDLGKLLEAGKGFVPQDNDMVKELMDGLKISSEKTTVTVTVKVSADLIDKVHKMAGGQ